MNDFPKEPLHRRLVEAAGMIPRLATSSQRVLPDFLILGAQRSGTTSLARHLEQHPELFLARKKEVHYFDMSFDRGEAWYRAHFPLRPGTFGRKRLISGEASPYYLFHSLAPKRAAELIPNAKLIAILRNPIDRAYSHYFHERSLGSEPAKTFGEALALEPSRLAGEADSLAANPGAFHPAHNHYSYLARGAYARQLRDWLKCFPREQLLVLQSADLFANPQQTIAQLSHFLKVRTVDLGSLPHFNQASNPLMDAGVRAQLVEHFRPLNRELGELLDTQFDWDH